MVDQPPCHSTDGLLVVAIVSLNIPSCNVRERILEVVAGFLGCDALKKPKNDDAERNRLKNLGELVVKGAINEDGQFKRG